MEAQNPNRVVLQDCLGLAPTETVVLVSDEGTETVASGLYDHAREMGAEAVWVRMRARDNNGMEPPPAVAAAMREADVLLLATSASLSHTRARRDACARGARCASMPGITREMLGRALAGGYDQIARRGDALKSVLDAGSEVHLTSPAGTDLRFSIAGRIAANDDGRIRTPGAFGNLPAGEAYLAPVEGTARGMLVVDASMAGIGRLAGPLSIRIEAGEAVSVDGPDAGALRQVFARYGRAARNVAELGIGTNHLARITGAILEDEKVLGTVHVALGDNANMGGTVQADSHLDGVMTAPDLFVDGAAVLRAGALL